MNQKKASGNREHRILREKASPLAPSTEGLGTEGISWENSVVSVAFERLQK
jgi:hypothetical protein